MSWGAFVARELAPARLRSSRETIAHGLSDTPRHGFGAATQPSASKLATGIGVDSDWQINPERIHAVITAHKHIAAMHQRNRLDDCQPQPVVVAAVAA